MLPAPRRWRQSSCMGPIIGKRTWGELVGVLGFPVLMDGGSMTAPNLAIWTADKGWIVENEGVAPDSELEHRAPGTAKQEETVARRLTTVGAPSNR